MYGCRHAKNKLILPCVVVVSVPFALSAGASFRPGGYVPYLVLDESKERLVLLKPTLYLLIFPSCKLKGCPRVSVEVSSRLDLSEKRDDSGSLGEGFLLAWRRRQRYAYE